MSSKVYRYDRTVKPHHYKFIVIFIIALLVMVVIGIVVFIDMRNSESKTVSGPSNTVNQVLGDSIDRLIVDEELFTMELPGHWKEHARVKNKVENSIKWIATKAGEDNRYITLYIDSVPADRTAVNRLLPVKAEGQKLIYGEISENCASFTGGGTFNTNDAVKKTVTPAKWQGVDFLCNLPRVVDNETGTGSTDGLNSVYVTGPKGGRHSYFFVYTDRNIQPKGGVLLDAIESFRAK